MAVERRPNEYPIPVKVKTVNLDAPTLVDQIGKGLLDHLAKCQRCFSIFAAQEESIEYSGCIEGRRIVSESQVKWEARRQVLALRHLTVEVIEEYLFDRLTEGEKAAVECHAESCSRCGNELRDRRTLIGCIRAALRQANQDGGAQTQTVTAVNVRFPGRASSTCAGSR
jgi:hypothetical protein